METKTWALDMLLDPLRWQNEELYVCRQAQSYTIYTYKFLYVSICIYIDLTRVLIDVGDMKLASGKILLKI